MELMFLVYLVQIIGVVGVCLIIAGFLGIIYPIIRMLLLSEGRLTDASYTLLKPFGKLVVGEPYRLDMYDTYGYICHNGDKIRVPRGELNSLFIEPRSVKRVSKLAVFSLALGILLPNKETTIYMAGAYMVQEVVTSDTAKEIGNLAVDATKAQLKAWASESPELAALLVQSGINEVKAVVKQEQMDNL